MYSDLDGLGDAVRLQCLEIVLGRHVISSISSSFVTLEAVTCKLLTSSGTVPARNLRLCRFLHFYAPKTSKTVPFPDFSSKVPKMTKGIFRAIFDQITSTLGLNDPLKAVHFSSHQILLHLRFVCPQAIALLFYSKYKLGVI